MSTFWFSRIPARLRLGLRLLETTEPDDEGKDARVLAGSVERQESERLFDVVVEVNLESSRGH